MAVLFAGGICFGQTSLTLQEAEARALEVNPALAVSRARIHQAEGQRMQAGLSPNPRLFLSTEDVRWWQSPPPFSYAQSTEDYAYVGQVIEAGGKRGRRVDVASSDVRGTQLRGDLLKRQIQARVSANYWAADGAAQIRDLYQQSLKTYEEDVEYIQNRVREGVIAEVDLMRIQVERDRVRVQAINSERDYDQALVELYRAMGEPDFPATRLSDPLEEPAPMVLPDLAAALSSRPEELLAREALTRSGANLKLQHADAKPDPEAFFGYKRDVGLDTLFASLQIDLPIRNRNQGNIGSAEAELQSAQANLSLTEANLRADFTSAIRTYQDEQRAFAQLPATRANAEETARLARAAYREGGIDLLRLLDAERSRIDLEIQYFQNLVRLKQGMVNVQFAGGLEMQP